MKTGMHREVISSEAPHSPLVLGMLEAMLDGGPVDPALLARMREPEALAVRLRAEAQQREEDWGNLGRYQASNAAIIASGRQPELVLMGDSITEAWVLADPGLFTAGRVGRGIAGQTSSQMLLRFQADVVALKPLAVHLMCGINDIAGNTGPTTPYRYQCNVEAMTELALANGIRVLLGSITPAAFFAWRPDVSPVPWVGELNAWLRGWCDRRGPSFVDYGPAMADESGGMRREFTPDGVHPNRRGYAAMRQVLDPLL